MQILGNITNFITANIGPNNAGMSEDLKKKRNMIAVGFSVAAVAFVVLAAKKGMWEGFIFVGAVFISPRIGAAYFALYSSATATYTMFKGIGAMNFPMVAMATSALGFTACLPILGRNFSDIAAMIDKFSLEGVALRFATRNHAQPYAGLPV